MSKRVLLIEDEASIAEAIHFLLGRDGCEVQIYPQGIGAVEKAIDISPDLIILDVMLPGRSGFDILTDLRALPGFARVPVIMLTAKGQKADHAAAMAAGASHFMTKPFANAKIRAVVQELLAQEGGKGGQP